MNKWFGVFVRFFFFFFVGVYLWAVPAFLFAGYGDWVLPFESVMCGLLSLVCFGKCVGVVWRGFSGEFGKKEV